jgi:hypothetical protein
MTTTNVNVARNMCGDIPPTVPVNIDCSLCEIGFPQAGGQISIQFFGPICTPATTPSPSLWLGYEPKYAQFQCPNPGQGEELDPNTWQATGYFAGAETGGCAQQYKFVANLTAVAESQINLSVTVYVLKPTTGGNHWEVYCSWSETLYEIANLDTTRYRSRAFQTPGHKSITVNEVGGKGDPVSYIKTTLGMYSMRVGCDSTANAVPDTCGFWDGDQWLTCLRGFVKSTSDTSIREFTQLGFNGATCGSGGTYCTCDTITLTSVGPSVGTTTYNTDASFVTTYGVLGLPGGLEAVGARQQIQIAQGTTCGIQIVVKQVSGGVIYICTNDNGAGWVVSAATVSQTNSPRILTATRTGFDIYLYALNFPNDQILADDCSSGGDYPVSGGKWYCTYERGCIQSPVQPEDASAGPFDLEANCISSGCEEGTYDPDTYWCLYGTCVQSPIAPTGYSSGPHALQADCITACGEDPDMVWICGIDSGCSLITKGEAIMLGYAYYSSEELCQESCPSQYWCTSEGCVQWWGGGIPAGAISGPYALLTSCEEYCELSGGPGYYCVDGICDYYPRRPLGAVGPTHPDLTSCNALCGEAGWYCSSTYVCGYYTSAPVGAISGPHIDEATCIATCVVESVSPFPISETDNRPPQKQVKQVKQAAPKVSLEIIKNPCRHLGSDLDASSCLPCGTPKRYECAIHGICTKLRRVKDSKMSCLECHEKKLGYEPSL